MTTERVTVSLPVEVTAAARRAAAEAGATLSTVVDQALGAWLRARLIDAWLAEHQTANGPFTEDELRHLAATSGVTYRPAPERSSAA